MGFLQRFFRTPPRETPQGGRMSSFDRLSDEELEAHLGIVRYGSFLLTDAIRPSYDLDVVPRQGYRHDVYRDEESKSNIPVIMASASQERLFDVFLDLLDPLGFEVDVVLESSHQPEVRGKQDLYREHIDLPVLKSTLCDYEELLLNDGCTGVAVLNPAVPLEVQFDEHKLLIVYGRDLKPFEDVLHAHDVFPVQDLRFITEAEHVHSSKEEFVDQFDELKMRLGIDDYCR